MISSSWHWARDSIPSNWADQPARRYFVRSRLVVWNLPRTHHDKKADCLCPRLCDSPSMTMERLTTGRVEHAPPQREYFNETGNPPERHPVCPVWLRRRPLLAPGGAGAVQPLSRWPSAGTIQVAGRGSLGQRPCRPRRALPHWYHGAFASGSAACGCMANLLQHAPPHQARRDRAGGIQATGCRAGRAGSGMGQ